MICLCVSAVMAVIFVFTLAMCKAAGDADEQLMQERHPAPAATSKPVRTWTKYPVPLDDDLQQFICELCKEYGVSMPLVLSVIARESNFDAGKIGDDGKSFGLMQVYASEHTDRCERLGAYDLLNPYQNVVVGVDFLSELLEKGRGIEYALMAYNGGPTYAGEMMEKGNVSSYAVDVMDMAECMMESVLTMEVK